jgi:hypothetical protein
MGIDDFTGSWVIKTVGTTAANVLGFDFQLVVTKLSSTVAMLDILDDTGTPVNSTLGMFDAAEDRITASVPVNSQTYYFEMTLSEVDDMGGDRITYGVTYPVGGSGMTSNDGASGGWAGDQSGPHPKES